MRYSGNLTNQFVIAGAGGLGREIYGWLRSSNLGCELLEEYFVGFFDEGYKHETHLFGRKVFNSLGNLPSNIYFILAVGSPKSKRDIVSRLVSHGLKPMNYIHDTAVISTDVQLGRGVVVAPRASVAINANIGDFVLINGGAAVAHDVVIGEYTSLYGGNLIYGNATIGCSATIGAGAIVYPGKSIGNDATVGIGSVVLRSVRASQTVFGNPARLI